MTARKDRGPGRGAAGNRSAGVGQGVEGSSRQVQALAQTLCTLSLACEFSLLARLSRPTQGTRVTRFRGREMWKHSVASCLFITLAWDWAPAVPRGARLHLSFPLPSCPGVPEGHRQPL